jgi:4-amino-4-deoxychorismate lyase
MAVAAGWDECPGLLVDAEGSVVQRDRPVLRADDLGVLRGDGVFETLLVVAGRPDLLEEHLTRLERSAMMLDLVLPSAERWRRSVDAAIEAWRGGLEMVVRLVVTCGTEHDQNVTSYVLADPVNSVVLAQRLHGIGVLSLERGLDPELTKRAPWLLMGAKSLSYAVNMAAQRWARAHHADDALFVAPDGQVLEAATSAVLTVRGHTLRSPPVSLGILPSIALARLFSSAEEAGWEVSFEPVTIDDLHHADGVWCVSSVRGAVRVHTLDGTTLVDSGLSGQISRFARPPQPA